MRIRIARLRGPIPVVPLNLCFISVILITSIKGDDDTFMRFQQPPVKNNTLCAFMNVTHNASYNIYDREPFSEGLDRIHNTTTVFEEFLTIDMEKKCEATICELVLLDPVKRTRKCFNLNGSFDFTKNPPPFPDPSTRNYFVSTGCSCKVRRRRKFNPKTPSPKCSLATCDDDQLKDGECGRFYKELSCTECRYDAVVMKRNDSFVPTNGFWAQSYVIRSGCRLSIDQVLPDGSLRNVGNYTGLSSNDTLNYVRKPSAPLFTCVCDVKISRWTMTWVAIIVGCLVIAGLLVAVKIVFPTIPTLCFRQGMEKRQEKVEKILRMFKYGLVKENAGEDLNDPNVYVSLGYFKAIQEPYEKKWEFERDRLVLGKERGHGQFGKVFDAILRFKDSNDEGIKVAAKMPKIDSLISLTSALEEIKVLAYVGSHPNICQLIGACTADIPHKEAIILLEFCGEGDLKSYLRNNRAAFLQPYGNTPTTNVPIAISATGDTDTDASTDSRNQYVALQGYTSIESLSGCNIHPEKFQLMIKWAKEIASGMEFLGSKNVIHVDLAVRNILLNSELVSKIGDFGLSRKLRDVADYVRIGQEYPVPFKWMALESLINLTFTTNSDVWSYGVVLFEVFSLGDNPYKTVYSVSELIDVLKSGRRLEKPKYCSAQTNDEMLGPGTYAASNFPRTSFFICRQQ